MTRYLLGYCQEHRKVSSDIHRASRIGTLEEWERRVGTRAVGGGNGMGQPWPRAGCGWCPGWKRRAGARALARWLGRRERTLLSTALHGFLADARYGSWSQQRPRADAGRCFGVDGIDLKALSCRVIYDNVYSSHKGMGGSLVKPNLPQVQIKSSPMRRATPCQSQTATQSPLSMRAQTSSSTSRTRSQLRRPV
jgi:hypothetical protein